MATKKAFHRIPALKTNVVSPARVIEETHKRWAAEDKLGKANKLILSLERFIKLAQIADEEGHEKALSSQLDQADAALTKYVKGMK